MVVSSFYVQWDDDGLANAFNTPGKTERDRHCFWVGFNIVVKTVVEKREGEGKGEMLFFFFLTK